MIPGMGGMTDGTRRRRPRTGHEAAVRHHRLDDARRTAQSHPKSIDQSRRRRIAAGAGVEPHEVNDLVKQFDGMAEMMKQMAGKGMRERMKMVRELQNSAMSSPDGQLSRTKKSTGKRMTPKEKAKARKMREKELRQRKRLAREARNKK